MLFSSKVALPFALAVVSYARVELLAGLGLCLALFPVPRWLPLLPYLVLLVWRAYELLATANSAIRTFDALFEGSGAEWHRVDSLPVDLGEERASEIEATDNDDALPDVDSKNNAALARRKRTVPRVTRLPPQALSDLNRYGIDADTAGQLVAFTQNLMPAMVSPMLRQVETMVRENPDFLQNHRLLTLDRVACD